VDTLRFLLGPLALHSAAIGRSCALVRGEDRASMFMTTDGGGAVTLIADFMAHGQPPTLRDRLQVLGTTGAILLEGDRLSLLRDGQVEEDVAIDLAADYDASYLGALTHFLDRLDDGGAFETSPEDNLETLRIVEQVYQTAVSAP
jgi:predicted dehydrogenase